MRAALKRAVIPALAAMALFAMPACRKDPHVRKAGEDIKDAAKETGEAAKEAAKKTAEAVKEAAKKTGEAVKDAAQDARDAVK